MAGLLRSEGRSGAKFAAAISAEFFGVLFFALIGAAASYKNFAIANGLALAVLVYATANVSGGHLNPAVTVAALATGHVSVLRGLSYIAAQIGGAIAASALHLALLPKAAAVGCSGPGGGATLGQAIVWELLLTAVLVTVVYAVAIGDKNFAGPAAIGITLAAAALTALPYTGAALNPARTLGPAIVFGCGVGSVRVTLLYVLAQLLGGLAAGAASWPLYGIGPHFGKWGEELRADAEVAYDEAKQALRGTYARLEDQA